MLSVTRLTVIALALMSLRRAAAAAGHNYLDDQPTAASSHLERNVVNERNAVNSTSSF